MVQQLARFDFWEVSFDEQGRLSAEPPLVETELAGRNLTDLFVFSHGWNNSHAMALELYERFFQEMRILMDTRAGLRPARVGVVGVIWPAMRWADELASSPAGGGAMSAGTGGSPPSDAELVRDLKSVFGMAAQQQVLDELAQLLADQPDDPAELERFQQLMAQLAPTIDVAEATEDHGEAKGLLEDDATTVFERMASAAPIEEGLGGAAGIGDVAGRLWAGAKQALRQLTYFEMKKRAGVVGKAGLAPLILRLAAAQPELRIHLLGHSFGARLVSFALAGVDAAAKPVKSVFLLQGAFSHYAFADALPHDLARGGALAGVAQRVDGPLLVSHSERDTAVGRLYPLASIVGRQDAAGVQDELKRWAAIGHDGAQAVDAAPDSFGPVGHTYQVEKGRFLNLDGNQLIVVGGPPSGAHGDIFYPEIAWAALVAAGIA